MPWTTVGRAAKQSGFSERHVWRLVAIGDVESKKSGTRRLVATESPRLLKKPLTCQGICQCPKCHAELVALITEIVSRGNHGR